MSKRIKFTADFDFSPKPGVVVAYKVGHELSVPDPHADAAIGAKAAVLAPLPSPPAATPPASPPKPATA